MLNRVRIAYACPKDPAKGGCGKRIFLKVGEKPDKAVMRCEHGALVRQPNVPYRGKPTPE